MSYTVTYGPTEQHARAFMGFVSKRNVIVTGNVARMTAARKVAVIRATLDAMGRTAPTTATDDVFIQTFDRYFGPVTDLTIRPFDVHGHSGEFVRNGWDYNHTTGGGNAYDGTVFVAI